MASRDKKDSRPFRGDLQREQDPEGQREKTGSGEHDRVGHGGGEGTRGNSAQRERKKPTRSPLEKTSSAGSHAKKKQLVDKGEGTCCRQFCTKIRDRRVPRDRLSPWAKTRRQTGNHHGAQQTGRERCAKKKPQLKMTQTQGKLRPKKNPRGGQSCVSPRRRGRGGSELPSNDQSSKEEE